MQIVALEFLNNLFGSLTDEYKEKINSYVQCPTFGGWDDIQSIIITTGITHTIWQWVIKVDPTFPHTGRSYGDQMRITKEWERIPEPDILIKALKLAAKENTGIEF